MRKEGLEGSGVGGWGGGGDKEGSKSGNAKDRMKMSGGGKTREPDYKM